MTRRAAPIAASAVLLLIAAPSAFAKGEGKGGGPKQPGAVQERSATGSATGRESIATATATCPKGTKAAGGGFQAPSSIAVVGLVYESVRVGQRSWRASAQLLDIAEPSTLTLTTYVYCRSRFPHLHTRSSTVPTSGKPQVGPTGSATCKRGTEALAGGFSMPPPLQGSLVNSLFFDSYRSTVVSWDARVVTGPAGPSSFTSHVYCSKRLAAPNQASAASPPNSTDFALSTASAACPGGASPTGGGFAQPASNLMSFLIVFESRRVGGEWKVSALHSGNAPAVTLDSYAYCG